MISPSSNISKINSSPRTEHPTLQQIQQHALFSHESQNSHLARNNLEQYSSPQILVNHERYSPSQYNFNVNSHSSNTKNPNFKINPQLAKSPYHQTGLIPSK